ncbi:MAG: apolipoprotein N-acyltransferase [Betaproteobacteria bacterium]|nr:apolipoprotein N-acyltransferase [Betaproteobacteria bacterium]
MMWVTEAFCNRREVSSLAKSLAVGSLLASCGYGVWIEDHLKAQTYPALSTVMIQGNVSMQRKHDMTFFTVNREQYLKTSALVSNKDSLIIWPESTITEFIPASIPHASQTSLLPFLNDGSAFLVGGLTYRSKREYYNSSILIRPDGTLDRPYNKMILMPFGEYTPLSSWFPWLEEINSTAAQFSAGTSPSVLSFPLSHGATARVSPLICYEDVVPSIARDATRMGAELLVNQTNDAWFGNSVAP